MKTFFTLIIFSAVWFLFSIDYSVQTPASAVAPTKTEYLLEAATDGYWDYMNEFKDRYSPEELTCLQRNTYFEAATESVKGRTAVIMVVLNRVESPHFPNTICGVVRQAKKDSRGNPIRHKCQFSWYCDGLSDRPDLTVKYNKRVWDNIGKLVAQLANGDRNNVVGRSVFYHSAKVEPRWKDDYRKVAEVGAHTFYAMN